MRKIMRRGQGVNKALVAVLAIAVLVIVAFAVFPIISRGGSILSLFKHTDNPIVRVEGNQLIGYSLYENKVGYYDGDKWVWIDKRAKFGARTFDPDFLREDFSKYYGSLDDRSSFPAPIKVDPEFLRKVYPESSKYFPINSIEAVFEPSTISSGLSNSFSFYLKQKAPSTGAGNFYYFFGNTPLKNTQNGNMEIRRQPLLFSYIQDAGWRINAINKDSVSTICDIKGNWVSNCFRSDLTNKEKNCCFVQSSYLSEFESKTFKQLESLDFENGVAFLKDNDVSNFGSFFLSASAGNRLFFMPLNDVLPFTNSGGSNFRGTDNVPQGVVFENNQVPSKLAEKGYDEYASFFKEMYDSSLAWHNSIFTKPVSLRYLTSEGKTEAINACGEIYLTSDGQKLFVVNIGKLTGENSCPGVSP